MGSRFVRPETVKLDLSEGDWILIKKRLTAGEQRDAFNRAYVQGDDDKFVVHPGRIGLSMLSAYLLDWSLTDADGQQVIIRGEPIAIVEQTLNGLDPDDFNELRIAVEQHEKRMIAERESEKKTRAGATASSLISDSRSVVDGVLTT
jgi:hypothetical protein